MSDEELRDCTDPAQRGPHLDAAVEALAAGRLVVLPTDTVYGIAADAFTPKAVAALLRAKGRGRQMPPPVLVGDVLTLDGLATEVPDSVRELVEEFWPGPLTVILRAQPSLHWDLGDTNGTVALRMPDDEIALDLLRRTGPLAVSSANRTGNPAALTAAEAHSELLRTVKVYLDGGPARGSVPSTIVDATGDQLRIVREGALSREDLGAVVPEILDDEELATVEAEVGAAVEGDETEAAGGEPESAEPEASEPEVGDAVEPSESETTEAEPVEPEVGDAVEPPTDPGAARP
ncbi:threonylcarbamoyl-AMP synthase [Occultella glacieicola]|uniref:L-threonylcarbamoyladenylate synthase n=1 Tax=Occultella glacieicola TaxID=2518684 RepID=A0ABY2E622_9MICO|nr:L-threonylcarbamoyladenylate synthase [Occultella glacieicola]TDE96032.1 threonylcarbamoyl-AMP synthase [Occultella glacieicola]